MNIKWKLISISILSVVFFCMVSYVYYLRSEITKLESNIAIITVSNNSLQKELENKTRSISTTNDDLGLCLQSKNTIIRELSDAQKRISKANHAKMEKGLVVDTETRKYIIDTLNTPLPVHVTTYGLRK